MKGVCDGEQVRYPEALNYFLSADVKAIKKTLKKSKPVHRMASCFMRMQQVHPAWPSPCTASVRSAHVCVAATAFEHTVLLVMPGCKSLV